MSDQLVLCILRVVIYSFVILFALATIVIICGYGDFHTEYILNKSIGGAMIVALAFYNRDIDLKKI